MVYSRSLLNMEWGLQNLFPPIWGRLQFFHRAQQRMLVDAREFVYLRHLALRDLAAEYAANTLASRMHVQHHLRCTFTRHVEKRLQHHHHELHRRVVVIEQHHLVQRRPCRFRTAGFDRHALLMLGFVVVRFSWRHEGPALWPSICPRTQASSDETSHQ